MQLWTRRTRLIAFLMVAAATLPFAPGTAAGHTRSSTGYSEIRHDGDVVRYRLLLEFEVLAKVMGLGPRALDARSDAARAAALRVAQPELARYLRPRLRMALDDLTCDATLTAASVERRQQTRYAALSLAFSCPGARSGSYSITYGVFAEGGGVVDDHTNLADYDLGGTRGRFVFDGAHHDLAVGDADALSSGMRFAALGTGHILGGLDHVLFVVVLLLGAQGLMGVLKVATAFTVAHSVTLALAVVGWVDVPPEIVEPLIALSIAYIAAENIIGGESHQRLAVVFAFGLLHGLGFAGALTLTGDVDWSLVSSLASFNVGVEVGQALIIAALFPLLLAARRYAWSGVAHAGATAGIGLLGLTWFVERLAA